VVKVTTTDATGTGWLLIYNPTLPRRPRASSISFKPGAPRSNMVFVDLGQLVGQAPGIPFKPDLAVFARVDGGGTVNVLVDIIGYARSPSVWQ
jgi:hypothetical protein